MRRIQVIFFLLVCVAGGTAVGRLWHREPVMRADAGKPGGAGVPLKSGPWGDLAAQPFFIEPPEQCLMLGMVGDADLRWRFDHYTPETLRALFGRAG